MGTALSCLKILRHFMGIACAFSLFSASFAPFSPPASAQDVISAPAIADLKLAQEIGSRITRVPEFQFIREEAQRMGVKAYLFGGTAAGFAHYVNWDLKREGGDKRYQPDRFDYDYTNIYRSTQDLDIVIDGPPEKAHELQAKLAKTFPHLQGNKSAWEVRLLRQDMGDKQALLNNPEFLNQHTDSNSTGMIEITPPTNGEPIVRDLRDWNSKDPYFLRDVKEGKLHYYFSPKHAQTKFAKEGRNPPILSVIRYLTKAFQYELEIRPEDLARIKKIIDKFDPKGRELRNDYVRNWLLRKDNGRKLIQNAVNIEYAWDTLEKIGLRKKLIAIEDNANTENSLAWWMSKEPLRSYALRRGPRVTPFGKGRTVRELVAQGKLPQDLTVAHETKNFLAFESITRAHTGDPNVLISRDKKVGESAGYGDGFYTQIGRKGARGTGITIRFQVHPDAREGVDFTRKDSYMIFHNKNALRVIPESLNLTPLQHFEFLARGEKIDPSEFGIMEKLKRRVTAARNTLSDEDYRKIRALVAASIQKEEINEPLLKEWAALPKSVDWSHDLFDPLLKLEVYDIPLSEMVFTNPQFAKVQKFAEINTIAQELRKRILQSHGPYGPGLYGPLLSEVLQTHPDDALRLAYPLLGTLEKESFSLIFKEVLPKVQSEDFVLKEMKDLLMRTAGNSNDRATPLSNLITNVFTQSHTKNWKRAKAELINLSYSLKLLEELYEKVLSRPDLSDEDTTIAAIKRSLLVRHFDGVKLLDHHFQVLVDHVLNKPFAKNWNRARMQLIKHAPSDLVSTLTEEIAHRPDRSDFLSKLVREGAIEIDEGLARAIDLSPDLKKDPNWLKEYLKRSVCDGPLFEPALSLSAIAEDSATLVRLISNGPDSSRLSSEFEEMIIQTAFHDSRFKQSPEVIEAVTKKYPNDVNVARNVFARKDLIQHPEWIEPLLQSSHDFVDLEVSKLFKDPAWKDRTDLVQTLVKRNRIGKRALQKLLTEPHWKNHPVLRQMCGGRAPDLNCLLTGEVSPSLTACVLKSLKGLFSR
jgi:hypothetical protein